MALTLDPDTRIFTVLQADLTLVGGALYDLDTNALRLEILDLLDDEAYVWLPDAINHNTQVTVAGTTFARTVEMINGFSIELEFTGSAYGVRFINSNNNLFDIENAILVPTALVSYISTNSAGLVVDPLQTLPDSEKDDIVARVFAYMMENGETYAEAMRLIRAEAAGSIVKTGDIHEVMSADSVKARITATANEDGRIVTDTDGL